jgi:hypothetical protein
MSNLDMTSNEVKALLVATKDAERRCRRYSRLATLLDNISFMLYVSASATFGASLADYLLHGGGHLLLAIGLALWASAAGTRILHDVYDRKAAKAAEQACTFRSVAEIIVEIERIKARLKETVNELKQELERRRLEQIHAN